MMEVGKMQGFESQLYHPGLSLMGAGTHLKIRLVEVVRHIPADLAVLAAFLHHGVEKGKHIDQAAEGRV